MPIISISRDFNNQPNIVRIQSSDTIATVAGAGYLTAQAPIIAELNAGTWQWYASDMVLVAASDSVELFTLNSNFTSFVTYTPPIGGGINPGLINQAAVYLAPGSILSGSYIFRDSSNVLSLSYQDRQLFNASGQLVLNYADQQLFDSTGFASIDWSSRTLQANNGSTVNLDWSNPAGAFVNGVQVSGTPSAGDVPTAVDATHATWQAAGGGGGVVDPGTINQVAVYAAAGSTISGSSVLNDATSILSFDFMNRYFADELGNIALGYTSGGGRQLFDDAGNYSLNFNSRIAFDNLFSPSIDWQNRQLQSSGGPIVDWSDPAGAFVNGVQITGTPSVGWVPTATDATHATWQAPGGGGGGVNPGTINQVAVYAADGTTVSGSSVLNDASSLASFDWMNRQAFDSTGAILSLAWDSRFLFDSTNNLSLNYGGRLLFASDGTTVNTDWTLNTGVQFLGLQVKEGGAGAKQGIVALSSGVGVVVNTSVTASSRIFYCGQDTNVTGFLNITAITVGSGFTITSSVLTDSGNVAFEIFEPTTTI